MSIDIYFLDYMFSSNYTANGYFMSKKCELTGKKPSKGNNVVTLTIRPKEDFYQVLKK